MSAPGPGRPAVEELPRVRELLDGGMSHIANIARAIEVALDNRDGLTYRKPVFYREDVEALRTLADDLSSGAA